MVRPTSPLTSLISSNRGPFAWDVGTYHMNMPLNNGTRKEDHGKYLTVWRRVGKKWLIAADAWSSDLPPSR